MIWLSIVPVPPVPLANWHVALYGYFPGSKDLPPAHASARQNGQTQRPYVWRLLDAGRIAMLSRLKPACAGARPITVPAGVAQPFKATLRCDGFRTRGRRSYLRTNAEAQAWIKRAASDGGGLVTFVHVDEARPLRIPRGRGRTDITVSIVNAEGVVIPTDGEAFERFLAFGGPGTAKAFGCGLWWLPDLFEPAQIREAAE